MFYLKYTKIFIIFSFYHENYILIYHRKFIDTKFMCIKVSEIHPFVFFKFDKNKN